MSHDLRFQYENVIYDCSLTKRQKRQEVKAMLCNLSHVVEEIEEKGGKGTKDKQLMSEMISWLRCNKIHSRRIRRQNAKPTCEILEFPFTGFQRKRLFKTRV